MTRSNHVRQFQFHVCESHLVYLQFLARQSIGFPLLSVAWYQSEAYSLRARHLNEFYSQR